MAVLVIGAAGAYLGAVVGIGAAAGWMIGTYVYSSFLAPGQKQSVRTPELNDLRVMGTEYGEPIPYIIGTMSVAGQMWWNSDRRPVITTTTTTQGGKGGGGSKTETTVTTYDMDALIGLCDNRIVGVMRIWDEGKLIYTAHPDSSPDSIAASADVITWDRMTVYTGDPSQMPDPAYEAAFGVGNVPAYRHRAYVFFEGLHLGQSGRVPNLTFEVVTEGTAGAGHNLMNGLANYWKMDETGGDAIDSHGNDDIPGVNTPLGAPGKLGNARTFVRNDAQSFSRVAGDSLSMGDIDFTFSLWVNLNQVNCGILSKWTGFGTTQSEFHLENPSGGNLQWGVVGPTGGTTANTVNGMATLGAWHHAVVWHDSVNNEIGAMIDGGNIGTVPHPDGCNFFPTAMFTFGDVSGMFFKHDGMLDEVGLWRRMLTPGERLELWNSGNGLAYPFSPTPGTILSETVTLEETVRRLLVRCGMVEGTQFDVSALASITRPVRALFISQVSPTRQTIDMLASTYFFDMTVSDKLYFRPRGGAIAATIPYEDLGAALDGSSGDEDPFVLKNAGDLEFPAQVSIVYRNCDNDYMVDTQMSDRLVSAVPDTAKVITLPMVMKPGEAKQVADVLLFNQAVNMVTVESIKVLGDYVALEPSDAVSVSDAQGNSYRLRLTSRRDEYPLIEFSAVLDDVSVLSSSGITDENYDSSLVVEAVPLTVDLLLDIPMLRDIDNDAGIYVVAKGEGAAKWPGCVIYGSGDDVNYTPQGAVAFANIFGTCTTTLGNWTRGRLIDESNRVTVAIGAGASLSSSTYERVLNNQSVNACVIGDELLQFIDATAVSDGIYTLSRLLRGSLGTERVMAAHGAGERFALLDPARMGRILMPNTYLGAPLHYKFITVGRTLDSDAAETFVNTGVNLKPISPVYLQVARDPASFDATITWERRSRFTVRMIGAAGIHVPPDEVRWEMDVYADATYATRVRTITAAIAEHPSAVYSALDQAADGLTPGNPLFVKIYPVSGTVGRGYPLTASA